MMMLFAFKYALTVTLINLNAAQTVAIHCRLCGT